MSVSIFSATQKLKETYVYLLRNLVVSKRGLCVFLSNTRSLQARLIALFMTVLMLFGATAPTASAIEAAKQLSQPPKAGASHTPPQDPNLTTKEKTFGAPSPLPFKKVATRGAADTTPKGIAGIFGSSKSVTHQAATQGVKPATPKITPHEITSLRTATRTINEKADGTFTQTNYVTPHFYKSGSDWTPINNTLSEDVNAGDSTNIFGKALGRIESLVSTPTDYVVNSNSWHARFSPSDASRGMVRIKQGNDQIGFSPVNANKVNPVITTGRNGIQTVHYNNLWNGVNVEYTVENSAVKESVILLNNQAVNSVAFHLTGATLHKVVAPDGMTSYTIEGAFNNSFNLQAADLILNNFGLVTDSSALSQDYQNGNVILSVQARYLKSLPAKAFPAVIDPGVVQQTSFGTTAYGNYVEFKSDGYVCPYNICNVYAGSLYDSSYTLRYWRGAIFAPYSEFQNSNNILSSAVLHLSQFVGTSYWSGSYATHTVYAGPATCLSGFGCVNAWYDAANVSTVGDIDVTNIYQSAINSGNYGQWLMLGSEDGTTSSFKDYDPDYSYVTFSYNGVPAAPNIATPASNQVFTDTQPSFNVGYEPNPNDANTPLQYELSVSSAPQGTGELIDSGLLTSTQWTMPDNVLQDGNTYYIQARVYDPVSGRYSSWGTSVAFKINLRTGKDKSQSYDAAGPVSVDLATGNLTTSAGSHSSTALGGALGIGLNYNSPLKSRNGLAASYWNVPSGSTGIPTTPPDMQRIDQNVDFNWGVSGPGSPGSPINGASFAAQWNGYFVAPVTGNFTFGAVNDDWMSVTVNGQNLYNNNGCWSGTPCFGTSINLTAGQVVTFQASYDQIGGPDQAHIYVTGAVPQQVVPSDWLQTGVRDTAQYYGLTGRYYSDDGSHSFTDTTNSSSLFMQRNDQLVSFNWGSGSPVAGGPAGHFLAKWTGYVTVPVTGYYQFNTVANDGSRVIISPGGTANTVLNNWTDNNNNEAYGTSIQLSANTPTSIEVDYYANSPSADISLYIQNNDTNNGQQELLPSSWLSPNAQVLPEGWKLNMDAGGNINYDHLVASENGVTLADSSDDSHYYTWNGSGYTPPAGEDGNLVRNADGTFTFQDTDGMTYIFGVDGNLTSATTATDSSNPTALKYVYQSQNGGPAHLYQIQDGVDPSRNATLYYSGDSHCGAPPTDRDPEPPAGMICALGTNDGRMTYLYYLGGGLNMIEKPGSEMVQYGYETVFDSTMSNAIGSRLGSVQTSLDMDALDANAIFDDGTENTSIEYDDLGRVSSVTQPAPIDNAAHPTHSYDYLPGVKSSQDSNGNIIPGYYGATQVHVSGDSEPNGYSRRIQYDNLLRTTQDTNNLGLSTNTVWDPNLDLVYSVTNPEGLMTSTVYDDENRPVTSYGPAPAAWFNTSTPSNQTPLSSYTSQVARTDAGYDQNIAGPAVAWFNYVKQGSNTSGTLFGAPKLHTTGINTATPGTLSSGFTTPPITADSGDQGIGFSATGKLRLPAGTYTFSATTPDGVQLWIDNQNVINQWTDSSSSRTTTGTYTISGTAPHSFMLDAYRNTGTTGAFSLSIQQQGGFAATTNFSSYLSPDYSLATSATTYDGTLGNTTVTNNYGSQPELGQVQSTTVDPTGLNLTASNTYETEGASGSLLRKTSTTTPGNTASNPTYSYTYYGATETRQNPCNTSQTFKQAGMLKSVTTASPDGGTTPGTTTQTVYDDAGRIIATETGNDGWTCTTYDARSRVSTVSVPAYNGQAARTTSYDYAVNGDPLVTAVWDSSGTITTTINLLGQTVSYTDAAGNTTTTAYDTLNRVSSQTSAMGTKTYTYNTYDQLTDESLGSTDLAKPTYDQYGRMASVTYPSAGTLKETVGYDSTTGVQNSVTYNTSDGGNVNDQTTLTQSGKIQYDVVTSGSNSLWYTYGYNAAGELTSANIGPHNYTYGYGTENSSCASGTNTNAGLNGNRTSETIDGTTNTYCYNYADQLVSSSDPTASADQYDSHGNLTQIGSGSSPLRLYYDSSDRNWGLVQYNGSGNGTAMYYNRDVAGRLTYREYDNIANWNWNLTGQYWYGYTGSGSSPAFVLNSAKQITEEYVQLPGGITATILPQQTVTASKYSYDLPSLQGNTLLMTDGNGNNTSNGNGPYGSFTYDPFGNVLPGSHNPQNLDYGSFGYKGAALKMTETLLALNPVQMGARVYLPTLGRFTSMDPVPGGNANAYTYALDPINFSDLSGLSSGCAILCVSASEFYGMQSSAGATNYLQTTVHTAQVVYSVAATSHISYTITQARAAAKPVYDNSTAMSVAEVIKVSVIDVVAVAPYGAYYGARMVHHVLDASPITKYSPLNAMALSLEAIGLDEDVALDLLKGESVDDEGKRGCTLPLHSHFGPCGPRVYLPGVDEDGNIEW